MKRPWKLSLALLAALCLVSLQACSATGGPASGVVIDEATGKPVADAIVVVRWHGNWTKVFGESSSACYHVETARTDANGRYQIAAWSTSWSFSDFRFTPAGVDYHAYKPGYVTVFREAANVSPARIAIAPFKGTKDEYFEQVLSLRTWACPGAGASRTSLRQFYAAAARDAAALAETQNQKGIASFLASQADEALIDENKPTK
jgi:hypothetical protein